MNKGVIYAIFAYVIWGLLPLYLKALENVPAIEILLHRMIWSLVFVIFIIVLTRNFSWILHLKKDLKIIKVFVISALMISINWFVYIWSVNSGHVVDASLGYFMLPLMNIMFGYFLLKEKMSVVQWFAVAVAAFGVLWLTFDAKEIPWIAIILAITFSFYALLRKTAKLGAIEGLTIETLILAPIALITLFFVTTNNQYNSFLDGDSNTRILLVLAGPITAIPLLFFAAAARQIPLHLLGFMQYIGPTLQMLLGIFFWHEAVSFNKIIGFVFVWSALIIYSADSLYSRSNKKS